MQDTINSAAVLIAAISGLILATTSFMKARHKIRTETPQVIAVKRFDWRMALMLCDILFAAGAMGYLAWVGRQTGPATVGWLANCSLAVLIGITCSLRRW